MNPLKEEAPFDWLCFILQPPSFIGRTRFSQLRFINAWYLRALYASRRLRLAAPELRRRRYGMLTRRVKRPRGRLISALAARGELKRRYAVIDEALHFSHALNGRGK